MTFCAILFLNSSQMESTCRPTNHRGLLERFGATAPASAPQFLESCIGELDRRHAHDDSSARVARLTSEVTSLCEKRGRVVDAFLDGVIPRDERDSRLRAVDNDLRTGQEILMRNSPSASVDLAFLIEAFSPLLEWGSWSRDQKRSVLAALVPDIRVADYRIDALGLSPTLFSNSNKDTRSLADTLTIAPASAIARP